MTGRLRAAFFDMGETLYTYEGLPPSWQAHFREAWREALVRCGQTPTDRQLETLAEHMRRFNTREVPREEEYGSDHILAGALRACGCGDTDLDALTETFFHHFRQTLAPYADTAPTLRRLRARGVFVGALTDVAYGMPRRFIADDLERIGILDLIDCWRTSVDIGFRKPNALGLETLCREAGCAPEAAIYVGNERKDVTGANRAGLVSVLIHRADGPAPDWGQAHTIRSLQECEPLFG